MPVVPAFLFLSLAALGWSVRAHPQPGVWEWTTTGFLGLAVVSAGVGLWRKRPSILISTSCALLACMSAFLVCRALGIKLFGVDPYHDFRYVAFLITLLVGTGVGLWRGFFGARWLAMALAAAGCLSAGMNLVPFLAYKTPFLWTMGLHICGAALMVACLGAPSVRDHYAAGASPVWTSKEPLLRALRMTIVLHFMAIPMLLVYSWMQPIVKSSSLWAPLLAALLIGSLALVAKERALGAVGLVLGGSSLLLLSAQTYGGATSLGPRAIEISYYYLVFWVPAGALALATGLMMVRPILRLLRP